MTTLKEAEKFWAQVCFDPNFKPEGRFATYRQLVTSGMMETLENLSPVAFEILTEDEWQQFFWDFLRHSPPKSAILRTLPYEASQYFKQCDSRLKQKYPYLGELMEYEYLEIQVRFAPEDEVSAPAGQARLNPAHALGHYHWPVHFISKEFCDPQKLPQGNYHLLIWREPKELKIKFMEVNPLVAVLLEHLKSAPEEPEKLLRQIAEEMKIEVSQEYLIEGLQLAEELKVKGILV